MTEESSKTRKRPAATLTDPANKDDSAALPPLKIRHLDAGTSPGPVLLSTPGISAPRIVFQPFTKPRSGPKPAASRHHAFPGAPTTHDLLLHSSHHPRLDYSASTDSDGTTAHYIAVYHPADNTLQVQPVHHLTLRTTPRKPADNPTSSIGSGTGGGAVRRSAQHQREELGKQFGTKKAKKALASRTENAIVKTSSSASKDGHPATDVQSAILDTVSEITPPPPSDPLAAKPIPTPNLTAQRPEDVYPFSVLVPPEIARLVTVREWQDAVREGEELTFSHRFPANRVVRVGKEADSADVRGEEKLKALRYLTLLLEFHDALLPRGIGRQVPRPDALARKLDGGGGPWPMTLVDAVRRRFTTNDGKELTKWHLDKLRTHICALALFVDGGVNTVTVDLKEDLRLDPGEVSRRK
ncbi:MAG: hypothetical protein FE78DRAFT_224671 [Acidomyces sp. 'richmondensis']|nr:MAG: hypothetical protein FE78DRAFT_224671 [Acidomyces sp. 'richmondensis']